MFWGSYDIQHLLGVGRKSENLMHDQDKLILKNTQVHKPSPVLISRSATAWLSVAKRLMQIHPAVPRRSGHVSFLFSFHSFGWVAIIIIL